MPEPNKRTIVPLEWVHHDLWDLNDPIQIAHNLTVENLAGTLTPENFSLYREVLSPKETEELPRIKAAIVHSFFHRATSDVRRSSPRSCVVARSLRLDSSSRQDRATRRFSIRRRLKGKLMCLASLVLSRFRSILRIQNH
jgi:hypothetical protein